MRRFDASFPVPVLGIADDVKGSFNASGSVVVEDDFCTITLNFQTDNEYFKNLLTSNKASFVTEINCQDTTYREFFKTNTFNDAYEIKVPTSRIKSYVEVRYYICSNGHYKYVSDSFNKDYENYQFDVGPGDVIGYKGVTYFFVDKYDPTLSKSGSIIAVNRTDDHEDVVFDYNKDKITIHIPERLHDIFRKTYTNKIYSSIYLTLLAYPAIIGALKKYNTDFEDISNKKWAIAITERASRDKKLDTVLKANGEMPIEDYLQEAQKFINMPYSKTFKGLEMIDRKFVGMDSDHEL